MKRIAPKLAVLAAVAVLLWFFPLVRVTRPGDEPAIDPDAFDPVGYVDAYWTERLPKSHTSAAPAAEVIKALSADAKAAGERFGRTVGMSRGFFFYLRGEGTVVSADGRKVGVALGEGGETADLVLTLGPVFGNAVRDAPGLIGVNDFEDSVAYNDLSAELNRRVESEVQPLLGDALEPGARINFVGCAELSSPRAYRAPLKVTPIAVVLSPAEGAQQ
ncbi:hypothetical protein Mal64_14510 [Pseudobythopirellula maris]|uniref:Periplasmic lipoprotein n=1 Tax=Pseudobythopirellula maris TaxID=2527991 RepID=A0A5C5ZU16_9BACT|nr:DUF2291 family protein [Pseudobythopirellula maris]TWT91052.1 hypothetical protein Mal64_14510 [Pseudobythopirellula maris]